MAHSKLPWASWLITAQDIAGIDSADCDDEGMLEVARISENSNPNFADDAHFIVTACNAHDDLLAACKAALEFGLLPGVVDQLRAAIEKAGG